MRLAECLAKIDNISDWEIRFYEEQPLLRPTVHTVTDNLHRLFRGWLKGGSEASGNQEYVYGIMFSDYQGHVYLVNDNEYLTFGELMEEIRAQVVDRDKQE
ncbi:MAG: hypothetical protein LUD69_02740 [Oscillospiraceae bacterium]|nr:hypothetical protein [Oscillospiraceae bacterium]MCD8375840.1 hypothetical protein [Oscillospiraceae bacterium]